MTALAAVPDDDEVPARLPPHDVESETRLLSAVVEVPANFALVASVLEPRHFYLEANRRIYEGVVDLHKSGREVGYPTIGEWLRDKGRLQQVGGIGYLNDLSFQPATGDVERLAERTINLARARELIAIAQRIAAVGYSVTADGVQTYIDEAERDLFQLAKRDDRAEIAPFATVMTESHRRVLAAEGRNGEVELPTGLALLDKKIGGLGRGRVTVIAARPGMGKTGLATGIAESVASLGEVVAFFSLEMPRWQIGLRMACARAEASVHQAINGWLPPSSRAHLLAAKDELKKLPLWVDETPSPSLMHIRSKARLVAAKTKARIGLIVVDYLQLMRAPRERGMSRDEQLSDITAGFKALSKELDCAVVYLSQLNREVEKRPDKRPMLSDLRESGGIEQDADDVIFVYRSEYYLRDKTPADEVGIAELIVAKQRNGPTGRAVLVEFDHKSTAFRNLIGHTEDDDHTPEREGNP